MKIFIVYCHPSEDSFTKNMCDAEEYGLLDSMKRVMLGDRLFGRAKQMEFIVFDNTSRENELREKNWDANLQKAYEIGKGLFA